jgi:hypothetical protein
MSRVLHRSISFVLILTLLSIALVGTRASPASGAAAGPVLSTASARIFAPDVVTVRGQAFTPGGEVYVALYDKWGTSLHETRWISASADQYGANGSADPATGFHRGGSLTETFAGLCGASVMVRAFDQQTAAWSNWLDIAPIASTVATFGPNGSADPAMGFRAGC